MGPMDAMPDAGDEVGLEGIILCGTICRSKPKPTFFASAWVYGFFMFLSFSVCLFWFNFNLYC